MIARALLVSLIAASPMAGDDTPPPLAPGTVAVPLEMLQRLADDIKDRQRQLDNANANFDRALKNWQACETSRRA